jgi:hypothetical protein
MLSCINAGPTLADPLQRASNSNGYATDPDCSAIGLTHRSLVGSPPRPKIKDDPDNCVGAAHLVEADVSLCDESCAAGASYRGR